MSRGHLATTTMSRGNSSPPEGVYGGTLQRQQNPYMGTMQRNQMGVGGTMQRAAQPQWVPVMWPLDLFMKVFRIHTRPYTNRKLIPTRDEEVMTILILNMVTWRSTATTVPMPEFLTRYATYLFNILFKMSRPACLSLLQANRSIQ